MDPSRWTSPAGRALIGALANARGTTLEDLLALCGRLEGSDQVPGGLDFRGFPEEAMRFVDVDLRGASFDGAHPAVLSCAGRVDLRGVSFVGAKLARTYFGTSSSHQRRALRGADFSKADLRGCDFERASTRDVCFRDADLRRAQLAEADLRGADLRGVDAREATFGQARFDADTRFDGARLSDGYLDPSLAAHVRSTGGTILGEPDPQQVQLEEIDGTESQVATLPATGCRALILEALGHGRTLVRQGRRTTGSPRPGTACRPVARSSWTRPSRPTSPRPLEVPSASPHCLSPRSAQLPRS